jgi:hypothetical protein
MAGGEGGSGGGPDAGGGARTAVLDKPPQDVRGQARRPNRLDFGPPLGGNPRPDAQPRQGPPRLRLPELRPRPDAGPGRPPGGGPDASQFPVIPPEAWNQTVPPLPYSDVNQFPTIPPEAWNQTVPSNPGNEPARQPDANVLNQPSIQPGLNGRGEQGRQGQEHQRQPDNNQAPLTNEGWAANVAKRLRQLWGHEVDPEKVIKQLATDSEITDPKALGKRNSEDYKQAGRRRRKLSDTANNYYNEHRNDVDAVFQRRMQAIKERGGDPSKVGAKEIIRMKKEAIMQVRKQKGREIRRNVATTLRDPAFQREVRNAVNKLSYDTGRAVSRSEAVKMELALLHDKITSKNPPAQPESQTQNGAEAQATPQAEAQTVPQQATEAQTGQPPQNEEERAATRPNQELMHYKDGKYGILITGKTGDKLDLSIHSSTPDTSPSGEAAIITTQSGEQYCVITDADSKRHLITIDSQGVPTMTDFKGFPPLEFGQPWQLGSEKIQVKDILLLNKNGVKGTPTEVRADSPFGAYERISEHGVVAEMPEAARNAMFEDPNFLALQMDMMDDMLEKKGISVDAINETDEKDLREEAARIYTEQKRQDEQALDKKITSHKTYKLEYIAARNKGKSKAEAREEAYAKAKDAIAAEPEPAPKARADSDRETARARVKRTREETDGSTTRRDPRAESRRRPREHLDSEIAADDDDEDILAIAEEEADEAATVTGILTDLKVDMTDPRVQDMLTTMDENPDVEAAILPRLEGIQQLAQDPENLARLNAIGMEPKDFIQTMLDKIVKQMEDSGGEGGKPLDKAGKDSALWKILKALLYAAGTIAIGVEKAVEAGAKAGAH